MHKILYWFLSVQPLLHHYYIIIKLYMTNIKLKQFKTHKTTSYDKITLKSKRVFWGSYFSLNVPLNINYCFIYLFLDPPISKQAIAFLMSILPKIDGAMLLAIVS